MTTSAASQWLAGHGVTPLGPGSWHTPDGDRTTNDVAHEWTDVLLGDDTLPPTRRLDLGLGLLDLLADYWVTVELRWFVLEAADPEVTGAFWAGYRSRLDAEDPADAVVYSLWVDWFEDRATSAAAFAAVLGDEVRAAGPAAPPARRADRVLRNSGPVPWADKRDVLRAAAAVPHLGPSVYAALLHGHHDVYGDLDPAEALELLESLALPPATEHLAALRTALRAAR